jgi:hypothetical protein
MIDVIRIRLRTDVTIRPLSVLAQHKMLKQDDETSCKTGSGCPSAARTVRSAACGQLSSIVGHHPPKPRSSKRIELMAEAYKPEPDLLK